MKVYNNVTETIGRTPLIRLQNIEKQFSLQAKILAKVESFNPAGSVKDRAALFMLNDAENKGLINKDTTIIEPTSGNTGIGLASIAASRGYKTILTMSASMSKERQDLLKAFGAEIVLTEPSKGIPGAIEKANELAATIENSFIPSQFTNYANAQSHIETTGPEIWNDTDGTIDIFVAGIGSGGTITGTGTYLKSKKSSIEVIGIEPEKSPFLSKGEKGPHGIQGIGAGFKPDILSVDIIDTIECIKDEDAFATAKNLARTEGILAGISSGAALYAAIQHSKKEQNKDKTIVVILPDTGERYLSTGLFS